MSGIPAASGGATESSENLRPSSPQVVLTIAWILTTLGLLAMLKSGARHSGELEIARHSLHVFYVAALLWYLARTGPSLKQLPELRPVLLSRWRLAPHDLSSSSLRSCCSWSSPMKTVLTL